MDELEKLEIWPSETGITDLPGDLSGLSLASMDRLRRLWETRREEVANTEALQAFTDQLQREWAIETGQIENLYTIERGVTETLIAKGFDAAHLPHGSTDKPREEVLALITDQRDALEGLFAFVKQDRPLSVSYVKELQAAMTQSQLTTEAIDSSGNRIEVPLLRGEWKRQPNYPRRDGKVYLYCPPEQTQSEMERLVELHEEHVERGVPAEVEAAWLHHRFTQIHPFQDGNGRVARALASLVLLRASMFPLIVPLSDKTVYLESLERADGGDLRSLVLLIARRQQLQYQQANDMIARLAPPSHTADHAADTFATFLAHRDVARSSRLRLRAALLATIAADAIESVAQAVTSRLQESNLKMVFERTKVPPDDSALVALRENASLTFLVGALVPPFIADRFQTNTPFEWSLNLLVAAIEADPDESVAAILAYVSVSDTRLLRIEPFLMGDETARSQSSGGVNHWADRAFATVLDGIRSGELR